MNNMLSLLEIVNKQKAQSESKIEIPSVQRGLVWEPKQVEFLWDSILRGFPIGGFVLSKKGNDKYDLMDGQQRLNTIMLGFQAFDEIDENDKINGEKVSTILWLDVGKSLTKQDKSSRCFFIKATTRAHPWGYNNDDECSLLNVKERREAMIKYFGNDISIYRDSFLLKDTFPFKSDLPIPLSFFMDIIKNTDIKTFSDFYDIMEKKIKSMSSKWFENLKEKKVKLDEYNGKIKKIYESFVKLKEYQIPFSKIDNLFENTDNEYDENIYEGKSNLEILFNRLNTGGTSITRADLNYSAIKAYWGKIKDNNNKIAGGFMPPQDLVDLLFRLQITIYKKGNTFENILSIKRIREIANDKGTGLKYQITRFYESNAEEYVNCLKNELNRTDKNEFDKIPKYVQKNIVHDKPEILLFLLYLIDKGIDLSEINGKGLALLLHFFCLKDNIKKAVDILYQCTHDCKTTDDYLKAIQNGIVKLMNKSYIPVIYSPNKIYEKIFENDNKLNENYNEHYVFNILNCIKGNRDCLLYAEREFINEEFKKYNPSDVISWKKHNVPWDYDHILPKSWSYNKQGGHKYKSQVDKWLYTIGNLAAIPFEINRGKNNNADFSYYNNHKEHLLFLQKNIKFDSNVIDDQDKCQEFVNFASMRLYKMYSICYAAFKSLLECSHEESVRDKKLKELKKNFCDDKAWISFKQDDKIYKVDDIDYQFDFYHQIMCLEIKINSFCTLCLEWSENNKIRLGIRKHGDIKKYQDKLNKFAQENGLFNSDGEWWFMYCNIDDVENTIIRLYNSCDKLKEE